MKLMSGDIAIIIFPADPNIVGRMCTALAQRDDKWLVLVEGKRKLVPVKALIRSPFQGGTFEPGAAAALAAA